MHLPLFALDRWRLTLALVGQPASWQASPLPWACVLTPRSASALLDVGAGKPIAGLVDHLAVVRLEGFHQVPLNRRGQVPQRHLLAVVFKGLRLSWSPERCSHSNKTSALSRLSRM